MINRMYDIMSDLNEIIKAIDSAIVVAEIEYKGINEENRNDVAESLLNVHIRLLKEIQDDTNKLYNKIDTTIINIKHQ
ncbi:MAG: hypothetical protein IJA07_01870 [Agathobacter sp.]|nr:hypothetical protein [Agathobacter sp.]